MDHSHFPPTPSLLDNDSLVPLTNALVGDVTALCASAEGSLCQELNSMRIEMASELADVHTAFLVANANADPDLLDDLKINQSNVEHVVHACFRRVVARVVDATAALSSTAAAQTRHAADSFRDFYRDVVAYVKADCERKLATVRGTAHIHTQEELRRAAVASAEAFAAELYAAKLAASQALRGDALADALQEAETMRARLATLSRFSDDMADAVVQICKAFKIEDSEFVRNGERLYPTKAALTAVCYRADVLLRVEASYADLAVELDDMTESRDHARAECALLKAELAKLSSGYRALQMRVAELEEVATDHRAFVQEARAARLKCEEELRATAAELSRSQAEVAALNTQLRIKEREAVTANAEREKDFVARTEALQARLAQLEKELSAAQLQAQDASAAREAVAEGEAALARMAKAHEEEVARLREAVVGERPSQPLSPVSVLPSPPLRAPVLLTSACFTNVDVAGQAAEDLLVYESRAPPSPYGMSAASLSPKASLKASLDTASSFSAASLHLAPPTQQGGYAVRQPFSDQILRIQIQERDELLRKMTSLMKHYRKLYEEATHSVGGVDPTPSLLEFERFGNAAPAPLLQAQGSPTSVGATSRSRPSRRPATGHRSSPARRGEQAVRPSSSSAARRTTQPFPTHPAGLPLSTFTSTHVRVLHHISKHRASAPSLTVEEGSENDEAAGVGFFTPTPGTAGSRSPGTGTLHVRQVHTREYSDSFPAAASPTSLDQTSLRLSIKQRVFSSRVKP